MKKSDLIKVIRKIVSEEVKKEVNKIFIKENKSISEKTFKEPIRKQYKTKPKKKVRYTSNESLNKVLNETVGGLPQEGGMMSGASISEEEYPDMGGKQYTTQNMADVLGYGDIVSADPQHGRDKLAAQTLAEKGVTPDQVGDGVVKALTRDYSGLMKVMNKGK